jgi:metallo-beta-lactamase class B
MKFMNSRTFISLLGLLWSVFGYGQQNASWTEPFPPHKIAGNLYYVGSRDLASYLIVTPEGSILINSSLEESVPLTRASVEKLGFKFIDIKILLISHAHSDHCAGSAQIIKDTGAKYWVMEGDVAAVEQGGTKKSRLGSYTQFPPAKVERKLRDGDEVKLGDSTLVAHLTPGHTKGCTTWTMKVDGLNAVIIGSPNVNPGYILVGNKDYPGIATDYEQTFRVLKALPVDLFLGAHGGYYGMEAKHARLGSSGGTPFVDAEGYHRYVSEKEQAFKAALEKQNSK